MWREERTNFRLENEEIPTQNVDRGWEVAAICLKAFNNLSLKNSGPPVRIWSENRRGMESAEKTMLMEERVIEMIGFETKLWFVAMRK